MNILIVAATGGEIAGLAGHLQENWQPAGDGVYVRGDKRVRLLVTGVGMTATAYAVTKALAGERYDFVLQGGVGGAFDRGIGLGTLVCVESERYGDMGAEDHDAYLDIMDMGLIDGDAHPYSKGRLVVPQSVWYDRIDLPRVSGLTVNMVTGKAATVERLMGVYGCQVESMEGAALHYVCLMEGVAHAQVRAISNYVAPRDRGSWKMREAVVGLNAWLAAYCDEVA